jgi:molybdopterin synthase catalytic subunit
MMDILKTRAPFWKKEPRLRVPAGSMRATLRASAGALD